MSIILLSFQMFVKYRLFVKTLAGYNLLCGVSVVSSGCHIHPHTPLFRSTLTPSTIGVLFWNSVRASLELSGSPFRIGTDGGEGG